MDGWLASVKVMGSDRWVEGWIVLQARSRGHGVGYVADGIDWPAEEDVGPAGGRGT